MFLLSETQYLFGSFHQDLHGCGWLLEIDIFNVMVYERKSASCLQDVLPREARHFPKTSCRCPKDVLNANLKDIFVRYLEDTFARCIVDVLRKTS